MYKSEFSLHEVVKVKKRCILNSKNNRRRAICNTRANALNISLS